MINLIMVLCIVIYYTSRGCIEGYTFASHTRRCENIFINPGGNWRSSSRAILDYHTWRAIEQVAIMGAIVLAYFTNTSMWTFILLLIASISFGWTLYECILNHICHDNINQVKIFTIGKYSIPFPAWAKYIGFVIAAVITIIMVIK